jgi:tetratricopeptide (TPR) repeat protein
MRIEGGLSADADRRRRYVPAPVSAAAAGISNRPILPHRSARALLAALWLAHGSLFAQEAPAPLDRFTQLQETIRVTPQRAVALLEKLDNETRAAGPAERARYLILACDQRHRLGDHAVSAAMCEQALQLARQARNDDLIAKAMLSKAYALFSLDETAKSHQLIWEAEKLSNASRDPALRVNVLISSGEAFSEEANLPTALVKTQAAVTLARQSGQPLLLVMALKALGYQYYLVREYDKGFEAVEEGLRIAQAMNWPGRMALLKKIEYFLTVGAETLPRGIKALESSLVLERQIGASELTPATLVNLSDCYLKQRDYREALPYAQQALEQRARSTTMRWPPPRASTSARPTWDGPPGRRQEIFEEGVAWYESRATSPTCRRAAEYGDALERAGDLPARCQGLPPRAQAVERAVREAAPEGRCWNCRKSTRPTSAAPDRAAAPGEPGQVAPRSTTAACSSASGGCWRWCSRWPRSSSASCTARCAMRTPSSRKRTRN